MGATVQVVNCRDGCGAFSEFASAVSMEEAAVELTSGGWAWLSSIVRWRCPACVARLNTVVSALAADPQFADQLDPRSRGALAAQHRSNHRSSGQRSRGSELTWD